MTQIRQSDGQEGAGAELLLRGDKENERNSQKRDLWLGMSVFPSDEELRHSVVFCNWKAGLGQD